MESILLLLEDNSPEGGSDHLIAETEQTGNAPQEGLPPGGGALSSEARRTDLPRGGQGS